MSTEKSVAQDKHNETKVIQIDGITHHSNHLQTILAKKHENIKNDQPRKMITNTKGG